jgi:GTP-binding protein
MAVVGRSNVGKSSLINFLVGHDVARTSRTPGRTRLINIFLINERFHFVDLPGYGYAGGKPKDDLAWAPLIETYVMSRPGLHGFLLLMDARHFPMAADIEAAAWMDVMGKPYIVVLTKIDKVNQSGRSALKKLTAEFFAGHPMARGPIYTSVPGNKGKHELLHAMSELLQ